MALGQKTLPTRNIQVRKHDLAIALQKIKPHPHPILALEQYTIPADLAAEILFTACYVHDDIKNKDVLDLGTGTGRLALGASILGASYVVGVDIDAASLKLASTAERSLRAHVDFILGEIGTLRGTVDTVLMNPPFGTKRPHADMEFLQSALRLGNTIYTIHKSSTRKFLERWLADHELKFQQILATEMIIPHQFNFHKKARKPVEIDVLRVSRV